MELRGEIEVSLSEHARLCEVQSELQDQAGKLVRVIGLGLGLGLSRCRHIICIPVAFHPQRGAQNTPWCVCVSTVGDGGVMGGCAVLPSLTGQSTLGSGDAGALRDTRRPASQGHTHTHTPHTWYISLRELLLLCCCCCCQVQSSETEEAELKKRCTAAEGRITNLTTQRDTLRDQAISTHVQCWCCVSQLYVRLIIGGTPIFRCPRREVSSRVLRPGVR